MRKHIITQEREKSILVSLLLVQIRKCGILAKEVKFSVKRNILTEKLSTKIVLQATTRIEFLCELPWYKELNTKTCIAVLRVVI
jgi:hypothetical protein